MYNSKEPILGQVVTDDRRVKPIERNHSIVHSKVGYQKETGCEKKSNPDLSN